MVSGRQETFIAVAVSKSWGWLAIDPQSDGYVEAQIWHSPYD
jgi:hypothetical protein